MATPVRNALLKWQLQQDERRAAEVHHRLMRMATPSPTSSLQMNSRSFDRRLATRRPRQRHGKNRDEVDLMALSMERKQNSAKHPIDRFKGSKAQSLLSPLRAKDRDNQVLRNDLLYRTKASRIKTNQLLEQSGEYERRGFLKSVSRRRSRLQESLVYENGEDRPTSPLNIDDGMVQSELSTMSIAEQTKQSITQHSDIESLATDANEFSAPLSGQSVAEMLASMEEVDYGGDCGAGDDQHYDVFNGGDRKQFSRDEFSADDTLFARVEALFGMEVPWRSTIVITCCLVIGTSEFFIEELITLAGLFSRRTRYLLSRAEQERIRDRMSVLQLELQGFQLLTSTLEVKSQTVLTELRQNMDRMRLDREKHQDMLAVEMQKLRRHVLHVTHELVEQEQESLRIQLEEIIKVQVINTEGADDNGVVARATDAENDKELDTATTEAPALIQAESYVIMQESLHDAIASSPASTCEGNNDRFCSKLTKVEPHYEIVTENDAAVSVVQNPRNVDNEQAQDELAENVHVLVKASSQLTTEELVNVQYSEVKLEPPILVQEVNDEHLVEAESASLSALEQGLNKTDAVASASKETVNVMPSLDTSGVSWDEILLLVGIVFLAACVVLRASHTNRRNRWFEERRKRRKRRSLRLAQQRARAMAEYQEDRDEWHGDETDGDIEEVSLMTPIRDNEDDDELRPKLVRQSSAIHTAVQS